MTTFEYSPKQSALFNASDMVFTVFLDDVLDDQLSAFRGDIDVHVGIVTRLGFRNRSNSRPKRVGSISVIPKQ